MTQVMIPMEMEEAGQYDVIVVGGGLAGCVAAVASARNGARTLLAEAMPYLGGNSTTGLPLATFRTAHAPELAVAGIPLELMDRLSKRGAFTRDVREEDWLPVDCEALQIELTHLLDEAGVELITHAPLLHLGREDGHLRVADFYSKDGVLRTRAKCFVDASGDAQVARLAGLPTPMGRQRDGKTQAMTLVFTLGGVAKEKMSWDEIQQTWDRLRAEGKNWRNPRDGTALSGAQEVPGKPGVYMMNVTRILVDKGTDSRQLAQAEKEGRYQIEEFIEEFLRPHIRGYENCYLTQIGWKIGVRETRRIQGQYVLQAEDLTSCKVFDDAIACNSYPVDIHSPDGGATLYNHRFLPEGAYYTIPFRSLVAEGENNLLACGRCASASHEALAAVRVLPAAMATGQAAGTAAALACDLPGVIDGLDIAHLRETLAAQGAIIG
ncbi:FAD-dependent oxidoreductase [Ruficoccus sp. ZRK36]|uniref:FAD-dependent oxidoreductase n=1 Tax=Ruficoccus sp. ZRK36 TaxID=2866311 RepID=UPI001C73AB38|nr:FAD-dependent oxidoreductase [Ruficoccus sp. ZRK36]QYY35447.1 FAD-dependent oxidoreductase [Ruficoccus sp. ZRK36]